MKHPNFILGLISFALLIAGVIMRANGMAGGDYVIIAAVVLGGIHWVWSIIDAFKNFKINSEHENRILWVILCIALPPIGGMFFYAMSKTVRM
jgi:hypothetical protein